MSDISFDDLKQESIMIGSAEVVWPIDEMRLSTAFSELPEQSNVVSRLIKEMFDHPNLHVRRIAVNACRRSTARGVTGLEEALAAKLSDSADWVRYDAAWAIEVLGVDSHEIRELLHRNSDGVLFQEDKAKVKLNPSNAALQARVRAKEALNAIEAKNA